MPKILNEEKKDFCFCFYMNVTHEFFSESGLSFQMYYFACGEHKTTKSIPQQHFFKKSTIGF